MLIPFSEIYTKYSMNISGILHLGAHVLQEKSAYNSAGIDNIIWIEGNPDVYDRIIRENQTSTIYNIVLSEFDDEEVTFNITNNEESSSILELDKHAVFYPNIQYIKQYSCKTQSLRTIIQEKQIDMNNFNFINLDLQGIELRVLRGMGEYINHIDYIYTEVNTSHLYKACDLVTEMDDYLAKFNFERVETILTREEWGDSLYIKK